MPYGYGGVQPYYSGGVGADVWQTSRNKDPVLDATLITTNGYYGVGLLYDMRNNGDATLEPVLLGMNPDFDVEEFTLTIQPKGDTSGQRLGSFNNIRVPTYIIKKGFEHIRRWMYDHFEFGGMAMSYMKFADTDSFQTFLLAFVYGGVKTMINPSTQSFPAFTDLCWALPDIDDKGYPKKARKASRNPSHAPVMWEAYPVLCTTADRKWIHEAQANYARTGKAGPLDHPLQEGSAHLLDAQISSAAVIIEAAIADGNNDGATILAAVSGAISERVGPGTSRVLREQNSSTRRFKEKIVAALWDREGTGSLQKQQNGNCTLHFIDSSSRIKDDARGRRFGTNISSVMGGHGTEIQFGGYRN